MKKRVLCPSLAVIVITLVITSMVAKAQKAQYLCIASGEIRNGSIVGNIKFTQKHVRLNARKHGVHIHLKPDLGNECNNTGAHYNPSGVTHGCPESKNTQHAGDLGNFNIRNSGTVQVSKTMSGDLLTIGIEDFVYKAIVIHQDEDDCGLGNWPDSKTSGHSGKRIACGVITNYDCVKV